jgi:tetracycline resistance efflux pump
MDKIILLSTLPPIIAIAIAIWSKKILPALLVGLLAGSYIFHPTLTGGFETAADNIIKLLSDKSNLQVLLFLYLFSGLIALIKNSGGIIAFSEKIERYVRNEKGVFYTLWALIPVTFIDCGFRIIGAGTILRSVAAKNKVEKARLAFMLNNTASPIVEMVPIATTFVGFNIANINQGLKAAAITDQSAYNILLHAIPFEFFSIVVVLVTFSSIFYQWKKPASMTKHADQTPENVTGKMSMEMGDEKPAIKPRIINLIIPMVVVIILSIFFFWFFGKGGADENSSLSSIITATDPNKAMLVALFISITITGFIYKIQKYATEQMTNDFISGANEIMPTLAILTIAWSLAAVSQDLGLSNLVKQQIGNSFPAWSIPVSLFILSSVVTYFIGEGWGAASLIMPFAIPLSASANAGMSSNVLQTDHMKYLRYASPYNFSAAGIAAVLFLLAGMFR